jgi:inorganic pyrophosphatase
MATLNKLPTFAQGDVFHVVVESPRGSTVKLKYDADLDAMSISRPLAAGLIYPYDWGFVPSTKAEDGDPVDAALVWDVATFPGVVVPCRALGVIQVEQNRADGDGRARNDRILALPVDARRESELKSALLLPKRLRDEIEHFFIAATALEGKDAAILGWAGPEAALALLQSAASQKRLSSRSRTRRAISRRR